MEKQETRIRRLAAFFRQRPNHWVDGRALGEVAGSYAWRTRVSELRRPPFSMEIENRQRTIETENGTYVVSEYRYVPRTIAEVMSLF